MARPQPFQIIDFGKQRLPLRLLITVISQHTPACFRQFDDMTVLFDKLDPELLLQHRDLTADGRGRDIEQVAGGTHRAKPRGVTEIQQAILGQRPDRVL